MRGPKGIYYYLNWKTGVVEDQIGRKTKFKKDDFYGKHDFYIASSPSYGIKNIYYKIYNMNKVMHYIYRPSPFKHSATKDQVLFIYIDDESYLQDLTQDNAEHYYFGLFGWDVMGFAKFFQYKNRELGKEMEKEIRRRKYSGRF